VLASPTGALAHARRGATLIETSTISVAASRAVAEAAASRGIVYLRAPVSGTVGAASSGGLSSFVSGSPEALEKAKPLVECWAKKIIPVGSDEQARVMKLAVNLMVDTLIVSLSEAFAFCRKGGVDPAVAIDGICGSAIASPHLAFKAQSLLREDFAPTFTVAQTRKDLKLIGEEARDLGVPLLLGAAVEQIMTATEGAGFGEQDYVVCGKLIQQLSGL
jgi:3-hydroxyisobutyrate dehydrogenase-like beta-hydroxyacid dehydrogenase